MTLIYGCYTQLATLSQFYQKVRAVAPGLDCQQLRLFLGHTELHEDSTTLQAAGIGHEVQMFVVCRTSGNRQ